ncbi:MAG: hypothetical protein VKQ33_00840 [Candidatus Sericytochromatia bacterium]|nr:hypothetical protein [Candidatus Sericytochromatia bacterium]
MSRLTPALCAAALALPLAAAPAQAGAFGASYAVGITEPGAPTDLNAYQQGSGFSYRATALTPWTEWGLGLTSRGQVLAPGRTYVFETTGLKGDAGLVVGPLRAGLGVELALLNQIIGEPGGTMRWHRGAGFVAEPYVGVMLPGGGLRGATFELSAHYPLPQLRVDPAMGPRVMLTMWLTDDDGDEDARGGRAPAGEEPAAAPAPGPARPQHPGGSDR